MAKQTLTWRAPRVTYCAQGRIWIRRECVECETVNLSESGLLVVCPDIRCEPGTLVRVDLPLPGFDRPMPIPSLVVRETEIGGLYAVGLAFDGLLPGSLAALQQFLQQELVLAEPVQVAGPAPTSPAVDLAELPPSTTETPAEQEDPAAELASEYEPTPSGAAAAIDLSELELSVPTLDEPEEQQPDGPVDLADVANLSVDRPVNRRVARRLRAMAASRAAPAPAPAARPEARAPAPTPARPAPVSLDAGHESPDVPPGDVPEWQTKEVYLDEERSELDEDLPSNRRLRSLYEAAVADVEDNESPGKKRKGWF